MAATTQEQWPTERDQSLSAWLADLLSIGTAMAMLQGAPAFAQLVVARLLGPDEFGCVRIVETALSIIVLPASVGMQATVVRFVAAASPGERPAILKMALGAGVVGAVAVTLVTLLALPFVPLNPRAAVYLIPLLLVVPLTNASRTIISYYQGVQRFRRSLKLSCGAAASSFVLTVAGTAVFGLYGWAGARITAESVMAVALLGAARIETHGGAGAAPSARALRVGVYTATSLTLDRVSTNADVFFLDTLLGSPSLVGQFGLASQLVGVASLLPAAATAVAFPRIAQRTACPEAALSYAFWMFRRLLVLLLVGGMVVALLGPTLVAQAFGGEYALASQLVLALAPTFLLGAALSFGGNLLMAFERADLNLAQSALGVLASAALNLSLIPRFGVWGAAWATQLTYLVRLVVVAVFVAFVARSASRRTTPSADPGP